MNAPYSPWGNWYGPSPQQNPIFIPVPMPGIPGEIKGKKHKRHTLKNLADQITYLEEAKKKLEGNKKDKEGDKKKEMDLGDFLKMWGVITFFGPPVGVLYYWAFLKFFT